MGLSTQCAQGVEDVRLPVEWLRQCCIVDTPGTNAVIARHAQLTERIVARRHHRLRPSADRPFSESERLFLSTINVPQKVVIVVNKTDIVRTDAEVAPCSTCAHARPHATATRPRCSEFPRRSLSSPSSGGRDVTVRRPPAVAAEWERSRFGKFEVN